MSTCVDYAYRIEGAPNDIEKARRFVEELQVERQDDGGLEREPFIDEQGALNWDCFTEDDLRDFDGKLARLSRSKNARVWAYQGCTDGCCEGYLRVFENGRSFDAGQWGADIGLRSARAAVSLAQGPDVDATLALIAQMAVEKVSGWVEFGGTDLLCAGVCAGLLGQALARLPELLAAPAVADALLGMGSAVKSVRDGLRKLDMLDEQGYRDIDVLLASIERLEISSQIPVGATRSSQSPERARL